MNLGYLVLGVVLLAGAIVDVVWTTLWIMGGAGPLTSRLMAGVWRLLRRVGKQNSRLLSLAGPLILALSLSVWIALFWGGWTFIFASAETVLIDTLNRGPISWADRLYFTGYTIFTLGVGDFVPHTGIWQLATVLATASGLLFITMGVTYVIAVLDAVTQKYGFASGVSGLGMQGEAIVRTSWNGEEFRGLELPLNTFTIQLNTLTTNHQAYPILHYFHSDQPEQAPVISIAVLDEALTLLRFSVPEQNRPNEVLIESARASVQNYLETLHKTFIKPADRTPPLPDLDVLREVGIPVVSDDEFASSLEELTERRQTLLGLVESDARQWPSLEDK